jgi:hypothetical protein
MLHGADLGIALYNPTYDTPWTGRNIANIGMSSGKIATYMQYGLPVLINELGEISSHVREKGLGAVTRDVSEIPGILYHFDPESMRGRCLAFFAEHLDAKLYLPDLQRALSAAVAT